MRSPSVRTKAFYPVSVPDVAVSQDTINAAVIEIHLGSGRIADR
ncbi:MAG: hypothetical protein ACYTEG_02740 [Planctomycetota bacterium]